MRTLYLRNMPEDVYERLEWLAARESISVAELAVRELADVSRRAGNATLLDSMQDLKVDTSALIAALGLERR